MNLYHFIYFTIEFLKLYTIDANIQKTNQTLRIPIFLLAFIVIILIMLYCIKIYHDVIKNKEILSITFWQIIIGYVWIMLKSGWYVSGNVIVSTVSSFLFMLICNFTVLCINAKIKKESIYS